MNTGWLIIGIQVTAIGCAFVLGGFITLVAPSEAEIEVARRACESEREKDWLHGFVYSVREIGSCRFRGLSLAIAHWPERPQSRRFIYFGLACLAIAAAVGFHLGVFAW
jgi:hypothetical protein